MLLQIKLLKIDELNHFENSITKSALSQVLTMFFYDSAISFCDNYLLCMLLLTKRATSQIFTKVCDAKEVGNIYPSTQEEYSHAQNSTYGYYISPM